MVKSESKVIAVHEDLDLFRKAVLYTARETGFLAETVEKDYFCSVILNHLYTGEDFELIFKGGTCLSKIHSDFYRMSEDLDFIIPISPASKSERKSAVKPFKEKIDSLSKRAPIFSVPDGCTGHNSSKQYIATAQYLSSITSKPSTVTIEVGLREEMLLDKIDSEARTLLTDPFKGTPAVAPFTVTSMSLEEAYSEKVRAALTRKEPAIRDFFDIDFAERELGFDLRDSQFLKLVTAKLAVPDNDPVDVTASRKDDLRRQLDGRLKPVLRSKDFEKFDLDRAFDTICDLARLIEEQN